MQKFELIRIKIKEIIAEYSVTKGCEIDNSMLITLGRGQSLSFLQIV